MNYKSHKLKDQDKVINYRLHGHNKSFMVHSAHDYCTFFEIYCREDYYLRKALGPIIDIGSNIGISARYFVERAGSTKVFCLEPNPANVAYLRSNLQEYSDRIEVIPCAVGVADEYSKFAVEETGRYGSLTDAEKGDNLINVKVIGINTLLDKLFQIYDKIDTIKIDIEGAELQIIKEISNLYLLKVENIFYETFNNGVKRFSIF